MADVDKALATQLANIEKRTGKSRDELAAIIRASGIEKHGELVAMLKTLGMGHGDASTLIHYVKQAANQKPTSPASVLDELYTGQKQALRAIHDKLMTAIDTFGPFDIAPKKTYVSLRRKKQFAMIGPATNTRVEVGINIRGLEPSDRLLALPAGQMCNYKVKVTDAVEVDAELIGWIRAAYDSAG